MTKKQLALDSLFVSTCSQTDICHCLFVTSSRHRGIGPHGGAPPANPVSNAFTVCCFFGVAVSTCFWKSHFLRLLQVSPLRQAHPGPIPDYHHADPAGSGNSYEVKPKTRQTLAVPSAGVVLVMIGWLIPEQPFFPKGSLSPSERAAERIAALCSLSARIDGWTSNGPAERTSFGKRQVQLAGQA